jgi:hypothetical protein
VECKKQESTYSQIKGDDNNQKVTVELVFYMIYTTPITTAN